MAYYIGRDGDIDYLHVSASLKWKHCLMEISSYMYVANQEYFSEVKFAFGKCFLLDWKIPLFTARQFCFPVQLGGETKASHCLFVLRVSWFFCKVSKTLCCHLLEEIGVDHQPQNQVWSRCTVVYMGCCTCQIWSQTLFRPFFDVSKQWKGD